MKLNCKPGDLAIVVSSEHDNVGKITRCLELLVTDRIRDVHGDVYKYDGLRPVWRTDRPFTFGNPVHTTKVFYMSDKRLRPLDADINDEALEDTNERTIAA